MFYTFIQNNSYGEFEMNSFVDQYVIIEADSAEEANKIGENIGDVGIYFDGVEKEIDCPCCGDRWGRAWDGSGTDTPEIFGEKPSDHTLNYIIHYKNGTVKRGD